MVKSVFKNFFKLSLEQVNPEMIEKGERNYINGKSKHINGKLY